MALPSFRAGPHQVRVPATSANLGPGFDALGLALSLYNIVAVRVVDSGLHVDVAGEGAESVRRDKRNLVVRSMRAAFDVLGAQPRGLEVVCANRIPHGRGLGSSAAAIVAGICAARAVTLGGMADDAVLRLATEIEGHPDNVAACLFGGATIAWMGEDKTAHAVPLEVDESICPVVFVPGSARQSTKAARSALPATVPHADAARTAGRAALLVRAFAGRPDLLFDATEDRLHEPYRLELQPRTQAVVSRLRDAGIAAVLSGSGPTVLALATSPEQAETARSLAGRGFAAIALSVDTDGAIEQSAG
jgi:homoserine kinase